MFFATIPRHLKNLRYVNAVFVPYYFITSLGVYSIISFIKYKLKSFISSYIIAAVVFLGIIVAWKDFSKFKYLFVEKKTIDLVLPLLKGT